MDEINGRRDWHGDVLGKPRYSVGHAFTLCVPHPGTIAPIIIEGRSHVPSVQRVRCPTATFVGFIVDEDTCAGRGKWRTIEIELTMDLGPR